MSTIESLESDLRELKLGKSLVLQLAETETLSSWRWNPTDNRLVLLLFSSLLNRRYRRFSG